MKKSRIGVLFSVLLLAFVLSGCGSVTSIQSTDSAFPFNPSEYTNVVVLDFINGTSSIKEEKIEKVEIAGRLFADKIAAELKKENQFSAVSRNTGYGKALLISGSIVRYEEGNAAARLIIGMGVGSSYFDAHVLFKDNLAGTELATLKVDKNSWVLGGGLAAGQTVEVYMDEAAKKIAKELTKLTK